MQLRAFGSTNRQVPRIGQGTWKFPTRGAAVDEAERALRRGIELGMTHIDTAEMYGDGRSEEIIGEAIAGLDRSKLFIVSKVLPSNASYQGTIRACERSLERLRTPYLDAYLLHWRGGTPLRETMRGLEALVNDGKIKALGVSNFEVADLQEAATYLEREKIVCNQVLYNLHERGIEYELVEYCRAQKIAIVAYTPFGSGVPGPRSNAGAVLAELAAKHDVSAHEIVLAWVSRDPIVFTIPKSSGTAHVEANARAGEVVLDAADLRRIDETFPPPRGPSRLAMV
jgi:diketogulonate reductase-like aldo/keto reductase